MRALCLAAALAASPVFGQSFEQDGIRYLSGGRTPAALATMREAAHEYNLWLEFSAGWPARYVEATRVRVLDRGGRVVLELRNAGPLLFVDLPRGRYIVRAAHGAVERARGVVVGEYSGMTARFSWPGHGSRPQPDWQG